MSKLGQKLIAGVREALRLHQLFHSGSKNMHNLPQSEKDEIFLDSCSAFEAGILDEERFRTILGALGYNATDIEDIVRQHR